MTETAGNNRLILLLIGGLPLIVILLASWLWFYVVSGKIDLVGMLGTANHGDLISPPLPLQDVALNNSAGLKVELFAPGNELWRILLPGSASCDENCAGQLYHTRQIRTAMGKYRKRIERIYLTRERAATRTFPGKLRSEHPGLKVLYTPVPAGLWNSLESVAGPHAYFLVDPRGWIMMSYHADTAGKDVMADLKFLLKNSSG